MSRVLLVDDDEDVRHMLLDWLEGHNYIADTVGDGLTAWEYILSSSYNIVVLDWKLPGIPGTEVLRRMREQAINTPVLMLTGAASIENKREGFDSGADDYLTKPFDVREFGLRVQALLRRPPEIVPSVFDVAGCVVDGQRGVVVKDNKEVRLMRKELAVLNLLLRHRGQLFSTQKLLDQLWKYDEEASEVAVRACIARLRKRLTTEGLPDLISTVYGMGYTIET
jgi:DNA-binding response OmpR family regulator